MIVWIVEVGWYYEGSNVNGVFSSLEKAKEREQELLNTKGHNYDFIDITEWEVE